MRGLMRGLWRVMSEFPGLSCLLLAVVFSYVLITDLLAFFQTAPRRRSGKIRSVDAAAAREDFDQGVGCRAVGAEEPERFRPPVD
jgi:hypothetical protein